MNNKKIAHQYDEETGKVIEVELTDIEIANIKKRESILKGWWAEYSFLSGEDNEHKKGK